MANGEEQQRRIFLYNDRIDTGSFDKPRLEDCAMFCVQGDKPGEGLPGACGMASLEVVKKIFERGYMLVIDQTPRGERRPLSSKQKEEYASIIRQQKER